MRQPWSKRWAGELYRHCPPIHVPTMPKKHDRLVATTERHSHNALSHRRWIGFVALCLTIAVSHAAIAQERVDLPSRPRRDPVNLCDHRAGRHGRVSSCFPGGSGVVGAVRNNFLIRVAPKFAAAGMTVAISDAPSDHASGMDAGFRAGDAAAVDTAAIASWLKSRAADSGVACRHQPRLDLRRECRFPPRFTEDRRCRADLLSRWSGSMENGPARQIPCARADRSQPGRYVWRQPYSPARRRPGTRWERRQEMHSCPYPVARFAAIRARRCHRTVISASRIRWLRRSLRG